MTTQTIRPLGESLTTVGSLGSPASSVGITATAASSPPLGVLITVHFDQRGEEPFPDGYVSVSEFARNVEKDPVARADLEEARKWLGAEFYAREARSLRSLRLKRGWSQTRLAEEIGTSQSHIARIEAGTTDIHLTTLTKLARALETTRQDLLELLSPTNEVASKVA